MHSGSVHTLVLSTPIRDDTERLILDQLNGILARNAPLLKEIKSEICAFYLVTAQELVERNRQLLPTYARHVYCYFAYRYTRCSLRQVGITVGLRDHTSIYHAVRKIERLAFGTSRMRDELDLLHNRLATNVLNRCFSREPQDVPSEDGIGRDETVADRPTAIERAGSRVDNDGAGDHRGAE